MAKGNLLLGMGRGKLGDVVLYRQNGQQMSRPRVRVVKNPRTSGQQIQRMVQATIAYAYAGLKTIVDHSFEGVQYGGKSMNYFMKRNMDELRAQVIAINNGTQSNAKFAIPNVRVLYPNSYIVSNGSLPPFVEPNVFANGAYIGFPLADSVSGTVADVMATLGVSAGDQITILALNVNAQNVVSSLNGEKAYAIALAVRRLKFKDTLSAEVLQSKWAEGSLDALDMTVSSSVDDLEVTNVLVPGGEADAHELAFRLPGIADNVILAACVIRSRKQGQSWLRSPQTLVVNSEAIADTTAKYGFTFATAYNAWMAGTTPVGVSEYILNGKPNEGVNPEVPDENEP